MKCAEIIEELNNLCPFEYALDWDNSGLLIGDADKEIKSVFIAVDATDEIINEAINASADMLITHHPLIFSGVKSIVENDFIGRRISRLIKNDISYVAMHTNFDVSTMGYEAADKIGLDNSAVLETTFSEEGCDGEEVVEGIGRVGDLSFPQSLKDLSIVVKRAFGLEYVKVFGNEDTIVRRVAISPGSGKSMIDIAASKGADVLITGDIDHHSGIDANMRGLSIIDAGHYGIEKIFIQVVYEYLSRTYSGLKIYCENIREPYIYI